jgi:hypothetical protein
VGRDGEHIGLICPSVKQKYFFEGHLTGMTGTQLICPSSGKSADGILGWAKAR